jgi:hypothetical protein
LLREQYHMEVEKFRVLYKRPLRMGLNILRKM